MLTIVLPATEEGSEVAITLEHSLASVSKWESEHEKSFFKGEGMSPEETQSYFRHMVVGAEPPDLWIPRLKAEHYETISGYINSKQSATWFRKDQDTPSREVVTTELIYYWMTQFQIPFQPCENWHFNRLMTLIKIAGIKQTKPKKMTRQQQAEEYRRLNAERRANLGTSG